MTEDQLVTKIKKKLEAKGCYCEKNYKIKYQSGRPDLHGCMPHRVLTSQFGLFFGFEVKLPGRERDVTERQQAHLDRIEAAGGIAAVITGWKQAYKLLGIEE